MNLGNKKSNLLILLAVFIVGGCGNFSGNYEEIESSTSSDTTTSSDSTASFVAVGGDGTILTSSDLTTWTSRTSGTSNSLNGVTFGKYSYVAVGDNGTILTSSDSTTWTKVTATYTSDNGSTETPSFNDVTYGNGTFVADRKSTRLNSSHAD